MRKIVRIRPATPRGSLEEEDSSAFSTLQKISGIARESFRTLQHLQLRVDSFEVSLHQFGEYCPQLTQLKLNGSTMDSLRDIGTGWSKLEVLWVVQTGLSELEGLTSFPNLKELYGAFNKIQDISALLFHETIEILDLEANEISDIGQIEYLNGCASLQNLNLEGNPIAAEPGYREHVLKTVKDLIVLDDIERNDTSETVPKNDEYQIVCESVRDCHARSKEQTAHVLRPKSAQPTRHTNLTEDNFFGNPIKAMRFNRKKKFCVMNDSIDGIMELVKEFKVDASKLHQPANSPRKRLPMGRKVIGNYEHKQ